VLLQWTMKFRRLVDGCGNGLGGTGFHGVVSVTDGSSSPRLKVTRLIFTVYIIAHSLLFLVSVDY